MAAVLEAAESGVRVNVVAPGPIETGMLNRFTGTAAKKAALVSGVPMKRAGTPEEIAQTIVCRFHKASFIRSLPSPSTAENWLTDLSVPMRGMCHQVVLLRRTWDLPSNDPS